MLIEHHENQDLNYSGTVIDIETIGEYCKQYKIHTEDTITPRDSREYQDHKLIIFGYINKRGLHIYCAKDQKCIPELEEKTKQLLKVIVEEKPLYALNCHQEMSVFFHQLNMKIPIDKELQSREFESKDQALRDVGIYESFGDPYHNKYKGGLSCREAWEQGDISSAIKHNRACLLKEQALMLKGRGITPLPLNFTETDEASQKPDLSLAYQPWNKEQEDNLKRLWNSGRTINSIADECKRTRKAIWMRLQRLGEILSDVPYTDEKDSWTKTNLQ